MALSRQRSDQQSAYLIQRVEPPEVRGTPEYGTRQAIPGSRFSRRPKTIFEDSNTISPRTPAVALGNVGHGGPERPVELRGDGPCKVVPPECAYVLPPTLDGKCGKAIRRHSPQRVDTALIVGILLPFGEADEGVHVGKTACLPATLLIGTTLDAST
jgi:hypothetical protein